jgi:hypothetical protein
MIRERMISMPRTLVVLALLLASAPVLGQEAEQLQQTVDGTFETAQGTQQQLDDWATEKAELETRYRAAQANIAYLRDRLAIEEEKARAVDGQVAELERRLGESGRLQAVIVDTLNTVLARLEDAVHHDLPFLPEERQARLQGLRTLMAQPDVEPAEKLRRLLEALLVEAQYGESVEVTQEPIDLGGEPVFVDLLRVGRLAMFWRTPDGERVGTYDPLQGTWVDLPGKHNRTVGRAMEMASRMRPIELIALPVGRINP